MIMRRALSVLVLAGAATLVACEDDVSGPGFVCDVTNPVGDILITPSNPQLLVHTPARSSDSVEVKAAATSRFGALRNDVTFEFKSSDPSVATVDEQGIVRALKPGSARITASACGESANTVVTVLANVVSVSVTPGSDTVVAGDSTAFSARALGQGGAVIENAKFTFSSSNPAVIIKPTSDTSATVISPSAAGTYTVNATTEGVSGVFTILALPRVFVAGSVLANGIDVGDATACGLITAGQAFCWGLNNYGQLGAQTDSVCFAGTDPGQITSDTVVTTALPCRLLPMRVDPTLEFASVSAGDSTTCGLVVSGRAYCWGNGTLGTVGNGRVDGSEDPALVTTAQTFTSISVGGQHACALGAGGLAYCWGADSVGQLGDSRTINSTTPIPVSGGGGTATFASISAGWRHTCALTAAGSAFCWGSNERGQLGAGTNGGFSDTPVSVVGGLQFASISAGGDHTCAVTTAGAAYCWGSNFDGQLGNGGTGGQSPSPVAVAGGLTFTRISASTGTRSVIAPLSTVRWKASGSGHTCGLTSGGAIYCWGDNADLQLGRGPFSGAAGPSGSPVQVLGGELPGGVTFVSVSTGSRHSCAVGSDGSGYCWGSNVFGALGNTFQAAFRGLPQRVATPR